MLKKLLALMLALVMVLAMAACGSEEYQFDDDDEDDDDDNVKSSSTVKVPSAIPDDNIVVIPGGGVVVVPDNNVTPGGGDDDDDDYDNLASKFNTEGQFENVLLYENDNIKVIAVGITYSNYVIELTFQLINKMNTPVFIGTHNGIAINGIMTSNYAGDYVDPKETVLSTAFISYDELLLLGIDSIAELEMEISYRKDNEYMSTVVKTAKIETSIYSSYTYSDSAFRDSITAENHPLGDMLKVNDHKAGKLLSTCGMTVSSVTFIELEGCEWVLIEVDNAAGETLTLCLDDIALNGVCFNESESISVHPGRKGVLMLECDYIAAKEVRAHYGIDKVARVSGNAEVYNNDYSYLEQYVPYSLMANDNSYVSTVTGTEIFRQDGISILYQGTEYDNTNDYKCAYIYMAVSNNDTNCPYVGISQNREASDIMINGKVAEDAYLRTVYVNQGEIGAFYIILEEETIELLGIKSASDIRTVEFNIEVWEGDGDEMGKIAAPTLSFSAN